MKSITHNFSNRPGRTLTALALASLLMGPLSTQAAPSDSALEQALSDARSGIPVPQQLDPEVQQSVLSNYISYYRLRQQLPDIDPSAITRFAKANADSPLSQWITNLAIRAYGKAGNYSALLAVTNGATPSGAENQCLYYTALLSKDPSRAAAGGRELWQVGRSQPNDCDPLFDNLRNRGEITPSNDWVRLMLAWQNGNTSLVNFVRDKFDDPAWQAAINKFDEVRADPAAVNTIPARLGPDRNAAGRLMTAAFVQFAKNDPRAALDAWQRLGNSKALDAEQRHDIEYALAFNAMLNDTAGSRSWVDNALPRINSDSLYELRIRTALGERDWSGVYRMIPRMPADIRQQPRWQYWLGRASDELGQHQTAASAYRSASQYRDFYGFAAADKIHRPYAMNDESHPVSPARINQVAAIKAVQRVAALYRINEPGLAYSEWVYTLKRVDKAEREAMAAYALRQHWYGLAVQGSITAKAWNSLAWRFPPAYQSLFERWGNEEGTDPFLLMGIARRESAFNPGAHSPAGARGLMQLMPGTATHVSRTQGIPYSGAASLTDPATNIRFGASYITSMLERYGGNRIAATAAYNAGPGRVDNWLANNDQPFDLFVESIPFKETRNYVLAVLSYRTVFESMAKGSSNGVSMLSPSERNAHYSEMMLTE